MIRKFLYPVLSIYILQSCSDKNCEDKNCSKPQTTQNQVNQDNMIAKNSDAEVSCKLTSPELQKRRETVLADLKNQILEKKDLPYGYAFKFAGTDKVIDELAEFVKSERACCPFFTFGLSFSGDGMEAWLNLTGPKGAKEMISDELGI